MKNYFFLIKFRQVNSDQVIENEPYALSECCSSLKDTEFAQQVYQDTGYSSNDKTIPILKLISNREYQGGFSSKNRAHVLHRFIPKKEIREVDEYKNQVFCGRFSKDGNILMTACQDRLIRLYETNTWKKIKKIEARDVGWSIISTDYSPDQKWLIYSSWSDYIHMCNIDGQHETHEALNLNPESHRFCLFSIQFSPDSNEILCGSSDKCIYIYDLLKNQVSLRIPAHDDDINAVSYLEEDNNNTILSGSDDFLCKVWDRRQLASNSKPIGIMIGHSEGITHISSKNDGRYFISNGKDHCIKLWDLRKMQTNLTSLRRRRRSALDYRDLRNISRANQSDDIDLSIMTYRGHKVFQTLIRAYFSPRETGQKYIYSGSYDGKCYVYDVLTGKIVSEIKAHKATIRDLSWHPYEPLICTTSWDGKVKLHSI